MNHISYYKNTDLPKGIFDNFEGCSSIDRDKRVFMVLDGEMVDIGAKEFGWSYSNENQGNVYCLYAVNKDVVVNNEDKTILVKMPNFDIANSNSKWIYISNPGEFMRRIDVKLQEMGCDPWFGLVEYVDDDYTGEMDPFKKRKQYQGQNEARFFVHTKTAEPLKFEIGSIEDIACILEPSKLQEEQTREIINKLTV